MRNSDVCPLQAFCLLMSTEFSPPEERTPPILQITDSLFTLRQTYSVDHKFPSNRSKRMIICVDLFVQNNDSDVIPLIQHFSAIRKNFCDILRVSMKYEVVFGYQIAVIKGYIIAVKFLTIVKHLDQFVSNIDLLKSCLTVLTVHHNVFYSSHLHFLTYTFLYSSLQLIQSSTILCNSLQLTTGAYSLIQFPTVDYSSVHLTSILYSLLQFNTV